MIYLLRDGRNPYEIDYHLRVPDDSGLTIWQCPEVDIWADDDVLLSQVELAETIIYEDYGWTFFHCPACEYSYTLWMRIIEETGDPSYGRRAYAAMELDEYLDSPFHPDMSEIDAPGWSDVRAVRAERARLDAQKTYNARQPQAT